MYSFVPMEKMIVMIHQEHRRVFHSLSRRLFNNAHSFSTSSIAKQKLRKKSKGKKKQHSETKKTTRDRMRVLLEKNELSPAEFSHKKASHLLELAQSRLSFFRNKIYQNWNPEYLQQQQQDKRPNKLDVVMDARWWTWNIAFALLPAVLIATFCELRGKPLVEKYRKQQRERQEKQLLPSGHRTSEKMNENSKEESAWPLTFLRNLISAIQPPDERPATPNREDETTAIANESPPSTTTPPLVTTTTSPEVSQVSTEALLRRIQQLERRLVTNTAESDDGDNKQSRIRSRAMADMKSKWEEERKKESEALDTNQSALERINVSEWVTMIKRTVSCIFCEDDLTNDQEKNGTHRPDQTATVDDRNASPPPVKTHVEDERIPIAQKEAKVETSDEKAWWRLW